MGNLSFWRPPDDSFRVFYPPQDGKSVILGSPDDSFWVVYPPQWEICHSGVPQMTVSGCFTPPPPKMGNLSFWDPPDDSFWVFYPPPRWEICHSGIPR